MMSFKDLNFALDEKAKEKRVQLLNALKNHPTIQEFMKRYECPFDVIEDNALRFEKWLHDLKRVNAYSNKALKENPDLGGYVSLIYDKDTGSLYDEYAYVSLSQKEKDAMKYLDNYLVFPLNESLKSAEFSKIELDKETPSYLKAMQDAISFTKDDRQGLYLFGNLGVGKSFLAACITNWFAKENHSVAFVSPSDLLSHLKSNFGSFEQDPTLERLKRVSILVIDDLGAEPITTWGRDEVLLPLLNARMENFRKTIFTSNYPPELLEKTYSLDTRGNMDQIRAKRFVDRVLAIAKPIEISGVNRRRK